jgi:AcrR family transcriptional regulator
LEELSGIGRTTIYYYTRQGILPPPHKVGRSRGLYGDEHVEALRQVKGLKDRGLSLNAIARQLRESQSACSTGAVDLVAERNEQIREAILVTATRHFATRGYAGTRMTDVTKEVNMAPAIFYRHFPTKRKLFLETVEMFSVRMFEECEPVFKEEEDFVIRQMLRARAFLGLLALSPDMLTFIRAEAMTHRKESREALRRMYQRMVQPLIEDFTDLGRRSGRVSSHDGELSAMALLGAMENAAMRLSWDQKYSEADYYWVILQAILGLKQKYSNVKDFRADAELASLVNSLVQTRPPVPSYLREALAARD